MCNYKTIKNAKCGYVLRCAGCGQIQVAFASAILSFTQDQFYDFIAITDELYKCHNLYALPDEKLIRIPTAARAITLVYNVNELKELLQLMIDGRNKFEYLSLLSLNQN